MIYRNVKTGAVIETRAEVSGGDWQEIIPEYPSAPAQGNEEQPEKTKPKRKPAKGSRP